MSNVNMLMGAELDWYAFGMEGHKEEPEWDEEPWDFEEQYFKKR